MDYQRIGMLLFKLGSYCFDVGSDIVNGLSFLHESRNSAVNGTLNSTTEEPFFYNGTKIYNISGSFEEDEIYKTYETCETKIHSNFDTEEDKARPKIGPKSYWKESPVKKEIEENWQ